MSTAKHRHCAYGPFYLPECIQILLRTISICFENNLIYDILLVCESLV